MIYSVSLAVRPRCLAAVALSLLPAHHAAAQFTSPAGYLNREARGWEGIPANNTFSYYFGGLADARFQQVDAEISKRRGPQLLKSVGFRADHSSVTSNGTAARSWRRVTLKLADGDFKTMGSTFSKNVLSPPVTVFSGPVSWPQFARTPSAPMPWDARLRFDFTSAYAHSGNRDLLLDWEFSGGTLANSMSWGSALRPYTLDAFRTRYGLDWTSFFTYKTTPDCTDPAITRPRAFASATITMGLYGPAHHIDPQWAGKVVAILGGANTAPNAPMIQAVSLGGSPTGVAIGARCNNLMVDTSPAFYFASVADAKGYHWATKFPVGDLAVWQRYGTSINIWTQGAWRDSRTGAFSLTSTSRCNPDFALPFNQTRILRQTLFSKDPSSPAGIGPYDDRVFNPVARYN